MVQTPKVIASVLARIKSDWQVTVGELQQEFGLLRGTVHVLLLEDIGLVKKSARWVPCLLSEDQKKALLAESKKNSPTESNGAGGPL